MEITITMNEAEFQEFLEWKQTRALYAATMKQKSEKWNLMAKKATWAIEEDKKKPGKAKIIDHDHALELLDLAQEYLA